MYWTKQNEKQVSHKYYRLHEDRRRFELGLRFYRSSFSYQCRQKNRYQYANSKRRKQSYLLLRKTSICPPYWNANSKALEPSLQQAPDYVDSAVQKQYSGLRIPLESIIFTSFHLPVSGLIQLNIFFFFF